MSAATTPHPGRRPWSSCPGNCSTAIWAMSARGASRAAICPRARPSPRSCKGVLDLMYPGYFGRRDLNRENLGALRVAVARGARAEDRARDGALPVLWPRAGRRSSRRPSGSGFGECAPRARELTEVFLGRLPEIRALLVRDVQAAYDGDPAASNLDEVILAYPGRARGQRLSHRACAVRSRRAHDGAHHDGVGALEDRLRHPSGREDRARDSSSITPPAS